MPFELSLPEEAGSWIIAAGVAVGVYVLLSTLLAIAVRFKSLSDASEASSRRLIHRLLRRVLFTTKALAGLVLATVVWTSIETANSTLAVEAWSWLWKVSVVGIALQFICWAGIVVDWGGKLWIARTAADDGTEDPAVASAMATFRWLIMLVVYAAIFLLSLENLGVDVTALIAGLGVGGIAIALALQNVLGDLFASLTITLDKPFVVGDFIVVGTEMGTIERVGLKTTRVRSLGGEQLIFGNNDLLASRIRNFKRMNERRIVFAFGVTYSTTPEQIERIQAGVRKCIEGIELARFDRCNFKQFGPSSLDFEVVYYVLKPEFNVYMDVQQEINLGIMRVVEAEGTEFAFPTQTLYIERAAKAAPPVGAEDDKAEPGKVP